MSKGTKKCQWVGIRDAMTAFVRPTGKTESAAHIKPLHWYVACRLVIEGGFLPDDVTPRPPFVATRKGSGKKRRWVLTHDAAAAGGGERTVLGGLKTKQIDVVVTKDGVGPCIGVSLKGTQKSFRNLTNRMEEAVGDCTNLHITYPAFVYGFLHVIKAARESGPPEMTRDGVDPPEDVTVVADAAIRSNGEVAEGIVRYHEALCGLADRKGVRNDFTRYEAVALPLVEPDDPNAGHILTAYPREQSPLRLDDFFEKIYRAYDQRFVYGAPDLAKPADPARNTTRLAWSSESPVLDDPRTEGYVPRVGE